MSLYDYIVELEDLRDKWLRRRKKLGKKASDISKIKGIPNQLHGQYFFGQFSEVDKCRSELVTIINRMIKENNAEILKKIAES